MIKERENEANVTEAEIFDENNEDEEYEEGSPNEDDLELISAEEEGADF